MRNFLTLLFLIIISFNCSFGANFKIRQQGALQFLDADNSNYVELKAPATVGTNVNWILPSTDGADGEVLKTNGTGTLSFAVVAAGPDTIVSKSTTYTATTSDKTILIDTSGGAWTLSLYAASGNTGRRLIIKKTTSDTTALTIDANASETIDGSTTYTVDLQYEAVTLLCDGTNWIVESKHKPQVAFRGYRNAAWNHTAGSTVFETVPIDTVLYDSHSGLNTSTGVYTCLSAGKYKFHGNVRWAAIGDNVKVLSAITQGSTKRSYFEFKTGGSAATAYGTDADIDCAKGDLIKFEVRQDESASEAITVGNIYTWFSGYRIAE